MKNLTQDTCNRPEKLPIANHSNTQANAKMWQKWSLSGRITTPMCSVRPKRRSDRAFKTSASAELGVSMRKIGQPSCSPGINLWAGGKHGEPYSMRLMKLPPHPKKIKKLIECGVKRDRAGERQQNHIHGPAMLCRGPCSAGMHTGQAVSLSSG